MSGTLYIVATPIGNMEEITPRALKILAEADLIAAEDTRSAGIMFSLLGLKSPGFTSFQKFNEAKKQPVLIEKLKSGQNIALVSDAGTPCISDPGFKLVRAAAEAGIPVVGVSGPCAAITALSVSGFPAEPFTFLGFLPRKSKDIIETLKPLTGSVIFYESPRRIAATIESLLYFSNALICLCNDMTKMYEHIYRGTAAEVLKALYDNPNMEKGEYTCVIHIPPSDGNTGDEEALSLESRLIDVMVKTGCTIKEAVQILAAQLNGVTKKEIYAASLRLKELL